MDILHCLYSFGGSDSFCDFPVLVDSRENIFMKLTFEQLKEIADRYGIEIKKVPEGEGGFVVDETGVVHKNLPPEILENILKFEYFD